jgi:hypothetical protein
MQVLQRFSLQENRLQATEQSPHVLRRLASLPHILSVEAGA